VRLFARGARPAPRRAPRRRRARTTLATFGLLFALVTVALSAAPETVCPEWRDPEYGYRLRQARNWQRERPNRPLVLVFGSSRAQWGVSPAAMNFPDADGVPLVYNFGYRAGGPLVSWLQPLRAEHAGLRPRAVLVMVSLLEAGNEKSAEDVFGPWSARLSITDARWLAPWATDPAAFRRGLFARLNPVGPRREAILADLCPTVLPPTPYYAHNAIRAMDAHGFVAVQRELHTPEKLDWMRALGRAQYDGHTFDPTGSTSDRALRALIARCRAAGVPVAVVWAPESPELRALYPPAARAAIEAYTARLEGECGARVFPAPSHLLEDDFLDGYHLSATGAAKYSRWLADTHLRPWLAQVLK
jgi:hypothetical protein